MIARSILIAAILFALYNLALLARPLRERFLPQSQWQENLVKAQDFSLTKPVMPGVIVGSSLADRLSFTSLINDFYNLSLSGDSPFTGLEIIRKTGVYPCLALIETNVLLSDENPTVLNSAFRPVFMQLRVWLPGLRERYQPANFIAGKVGEKLVSWSLKPVERLLQKSTNNVIPAGQKSAFDEVIELHKAENEIQPEPGDLHRHIEKMRSLISDLESHGTRCIFIEMPVDNALADLPRPTLIRNTIKQAFPSSRYLWVIPNSQHRYVTEDGIHLSGAEAEFFAEQIRATLDQAGFLKKTAPGP